VLPHQVVVTTGASKLGWGCHTLSLRSAAFGPMRSPQDTSVSRDVGCATISVGNIYIYIYLSVDTFNQVSVYINKQGRTKRVISRDPEYTSRRTVARCVTNGVVSTTVTANRERSFKRLWEPTLDRFATYSNRRLSVFPHGKSIYGRWLRTHLHYNGQVGSLRTSSATSRTTSIEKRSHKECASSFWRRVVDQGRRGSRRY